MAVYRTNYNNIRRLELDRAVYPVGILLKAAIMNNEEIKIEARKKCNTRIYEVQYCRKLGEGVV